MAGQKTGRELLKQAKLRAHALEPDDVHSIVSAGEPVTLLDVRENDEWRAGHLPGALHLSRSWLELQVGFPEQGLELQRTGRLRALPVEVVLEDDEPCPDVAHQRGRGPPLVRPELEGLLHGRQQVVRVAARHHHPRAADGR